MIEYEYSFKVKNLTPYIEYCEKNKYKKISETKQTRELFTNTNQILARITTNKYDNKIAKFLDFKDENDTDKILKKSRETIPLEINKENEEAVNSILNIHGYKKKKHLERKRIVYNKENVTFEIDEYSSPEIMYVVAIEGEKNAVDKTYSEISKIITDK